MKKFLTQPVPKRAILAFAGGFWLIAGFNVVRIGFQEMNAGHGWTNWIALVAMVATLIVFFFAIFQRMYRKNATRIIDNPNPASIWSAYELRGYLIVVFMISLGITARRLLSEYQLAIGSFYMGLGTALFLGGLLFVYRSITLKLAPQTAERTA